MKIIDLINHYEGSSLKKEQNFYDLLYSIKVSNCVEYENLTINLVEHFECLREYDSRNYKNNANHLWLILKRGICPDMNILDMLDNVDNLLTELPEDLEFMKLI